MSIGTVVRADLSVLRRSKLAWSVFAFLLLPTFGAFYRSIDSHPVGKTSEGITAVTTAVMIVIPIVALVSSILAIAAERETGTIRFLLGFPNDRFEIVLGKVVSRATLVNGGLGLGFLFVGLMAIVWADSVPLDMLVQSMLLTMLFATSYIGLAVGISAAVTNQARAFTVAVGSYFFWTIAWLPSFPYSASASVQSLLAGLLGHELSPSTVVNIEILNPMVAYLQATQVLGPSFEKMARNSSTANVLASPSVAIAMLVAWAVLPLALGYWRFRNSEIN